VATLGWFPLPIAGLVKNQTKKGENFSFSPTCQVYAWQRLIFSSSLRQLLLRVLEKRDIRPSWGCNM